MFIILFYLCWRWNSWYLHYDSVLVWLKAVFSSSSPCRSNGTQLFLRETHTSSAPFYSFDSLRCQCRWYIWRGVTKELTRHPEVMVLNAPMTGATSVASSVTFSFFVRAYLINLCFSSVSLCHVSPQKPKMGDPLKLELKAVVRSWNGFWELSSVPVEEQQAGLVPDPSLQSFCYILYRTLSGRWR